MQGRIGFIAVWVATTAAGMAISWAGVGDALRGTALPTQDLAAKVPVHEGRPPASEPAGTPVPVLSAVATEAPPTRKPAPRPTPKSTPKPSSERPTPRPSAPPSTAQGDVRTYVVKSGRVVLALSADSARLVSATPNSGFQAKVWRQDQWLRVDLTDGVKGSAVFAKWNGHAPLVQVYEY
ncbi:superantigen-like protein SSL4 [Actinocorallia populi]|uniref:hypothetical protein n=1 Tax=Actinocorallia populi TaxID=2079200 RepID=UPI0013005CB7|nr:hypothetical protein [Actinocorallia populi]